MGLCLMVISFRTDFSHGYHIGKFKESHSNTRYAVNSLFLDNMYTQCQSSHHLGYYEFQSFCEIKIITLLYFGVVPSTSFSSRQNYLIIDPAYFHQLSFISP